MARAFRAWAINRRGKNSVRNLRYGPQTRLVRGMYLTGEGRGILLNDDILNVRGLCCGMKLFLVEVE